MQYKELWVTFISCPAPNVLSRSFGKLCKQPSQTSARRTSKQIAHNKSKIKMSRSSSGYKVFVGRIPNDARTRDLENFFKDHGFSKCIRDINLKNGFAFVVSVLLIKYKLKLSLKVLSHFKLNPLRN